MLKSEAIICIRKILSTPDAVMADVEVASDIVDALAAYGVKFNTGTDKTDVAPDPKKAAFDAIIELTAPLPVNNRFDILKSAMVFYGIDKGLG